MTKQLQERFGQHVDVRVLKNGPGNLHRDEQYLFPSSRQSCGHMRGHVREVLLHTHQHQLIAARTVFTSRSLLLNAKLMRLGSRPLGELLFANGKASWLVREFAHLEPGAAAFSLVRKTAGRSLRSCWARRTLFIFDQQPLLVTEIFLPSLFAHAAEQAPVEAANLLESTWAAAECDGRENQMQQSTFVLG